MKADETTAAAAEPPAAPDPAPAEPPVRSFAVLLKPHGDLFDGQVVFAEASAIKAAVAAGLARAATDAEVALADHFVFALQALGVKE